MSIERVIISGGGTGGHIFPAVAIADKIMEHNPNAEILFIGAEGKMEMEKVPAAGYAIEGLPIRGFQRKFTWSNFLLPFKILTSMWKARKIIKKFKPDVVVGVGGYASGPTLQMATMLRIPTVIQEQNGFAGKTNKILGKKVNKVCVAYENMEQFFPKEKIVFTGNPVRKNIVDIEGKRQEAFAFFNLDAQKKTLLVVGGSLGARTFNNCLVGKIKIFQQENIQLIWQCGKTDYSSLIEATRNIDMTGIVLTDFISRMDFAYAVADAIVSRAGAIAVSELSIIGKPMILIPSPNVAEDHQTKNAMALVSKNAALMIPDVEGQEKMVLAMLSLMKDEEQQNNLKDQLKPFAIKDADERIYQTLISVVE
jgi:UDP-N-acetylglucosamine--N-acetylmuramyl-(pentapeptide) pyrophosphoryl-undecaprenol N-acetylglucosamine transferase